MLSCLQCGNCCLGLEWTFRYKAENEDPKAPSEKVTQRAESRLRAYGLMYHEFKRAEIKDKKIALTYKVGSCQHLGFENGKAFCKIHDKRPPACRDYYCEKAKK